MKNIKDSFCLGVDNMPKWFKLEIEKENVKVNRYYGYEYFTCNVNNVLVPHNDYIVLTEDNQVLAKSSLFKYRLIFDLTYYPENKQFIEYFNSKEEVNKFIVDILNNNILIKGLPPMINEYKSDLEDNKDLLEEFTNLIFKQYVREI